MSKKQRLKILAVLGAMIIAVALIQATPLAVLPHSADDFVQGFALGIGISLVIGWLVIRRGSVKE